MQEREENRLRTPPVERFAGTESLVDLDATFEKLAAEGRENRRGGRRITVFKRGGTTLVAFLFEEGGKLPEHSARGLVNIHCLDGEILVDTPGEQYRLHPDTFIVLSPDVPHSVEAIKPSRMLLTVHLEESHQGEAR